MSGDAKENSAPDLSLHTSQLKDLGSDPAKWFQVLCDCLKVANNLQRKRLLKYFFNQARIYLDQDLYRRNEDYAKILAEEALFIGASNTDDARDAFRVASALCKRVPIIHMEFAQFEMNNGRAEKARKVLETSRLILPDDASITEALRKLNAGRTDLFEKAYPTAALLKPLANIGNIRQESKIPKLDSIDEKLFVRPKDQHSLTDNVLKSPFRPDLYKRELEALDFPQSPRTPKLRTAIDVSKSLQKPCLINRTKKESTFDDLKTPSPPRLSYSVTKSLSNNFNFGRMARQPTSTIKSGAALPPSGVKAVEKPRRVVCSLNKENNSADGWNFKPIDYNNESDDDHMPQVSQPQQVPRLKVTQHQERERAKVTQGHEQQGGNQGHEPEQLKVLPPTYKNSSRELQGRVDLEPKPQGYNEPRHRAVQGHVHPIAEVPQGHALRPSRQVDPNARTFECQRETCSDEGTNLKSPTERNGSQNSPYYKKDLDNELCIWLQEAKTLRICRKLYVVMKVLGEGGSSKVYEVFDVAAKTMKAVKHVTLKGCDSTIKQGFLNEVKFLEKLRHNPNIIHLYNYELNHDDLYIVMECGSTDLSKLLQRSGTKLQPYEVKYFWRKMLDAVHTIHKHGVIHLDLKPANFLIVKGTLKLIDFGIANSIQTGATSVIKDTQLGTLNYMAPEAILDMSGTYDNNAPKFKISPRSDVWSLGCILYLMLFSRTPFQHIKRQLLKLNAITNPNSKIEFGDYPDMQLVHTVQACLRRDPKTRPTVEQLIEHS